MGENSLTERLIKDHEQILGLLEKINKLSGLTKEGRETLTQLRDCLLAHLEREDDLFYPGLRKATRSDVELYKTMMKFENEMRVISLAAIEFFNKYLDKGETADFAAQFEKFSKVLRERIKREEGILYAAYVKLKIH